jgi:hypothetical protein
MLDLMVFGAVFAVLGLVVVWWDEFPAPRHDGRE